MMMNEALKITSSTPNLEEFDPRIIPFQFQVIKDIRRNFDYSLGVHEVLLSGSVGSAKSILLAHIVVTHCLENPGAVAAICRKALPRLRQTLWKKIIDHLRGSSLIEGIHWKPNFTRLEIKFANGSEIIPYTWADGQFDKCRSLELSLLAIEEVTENSSDDFYKELRLRVGRLPSVKENVVVGATNPDAPSHWAHEYWISSDLPTRHVYYSVTEENPFLPRWYIRQLKSEYDPKMAQRMLYGKWVEISREVIYHAYLRERNFRNEEYQVDKRYPVHISWDFNIGHGKPLSCVLFQYINDSFHFFDEVVVEGMRTEGSCEELDGRGFIKPDWTYIINGDASGFNRNTRSTNSDYDIIKKYFANYKTELKFSLQIPASNPLVRERHNKVNSYCYNELKQVRFFIYKNAKMADKAMRLTQLRKGARFEEDDSKDFQHIGTAIGYGIWATLLWKNRGKQGTKQL